MSFKEVLGLVRATKPGKPLVLDIMRRCVPAATAASSSKEALPKEASSGPSDPTEEVLPKEALSEEAHVKEVIPPEAGPKGAPEEAPSEKTHPKQALSEEAGKGTQSRTPPPTNDQDNKKPAPIAEGPALVSQQNAVAPDSSNKRRRRKKDPNSPKEPRSAYIFFLIEMRPKVVAEFPGRTPQEITSIVGSRWNETAPEHKKKYQDLHEQDKVRYRNELAEYVKKQAIEATGDAEGEIEVEGQAKAIAPQKEEMATASPSKRQNDTEGSKKKERKLTPAGRPACVVEGCTKQNQGKKKNYMCNKHFTTSGDGMGAGATANNLEAAPASPTPASSNLKTPGSKRKTPSKSTSQSKMSTSAKRPRSAGRKLCSVDQCTKGKQPGTNGLCVSHWNEHIKAQAQADGTSYKDMRVAKTFDADVYFGSVKTYFEADKENPKSEALWNIVYDDGDEEDLNVRELAAALRLYNKKKSNDPKANGGGAELPAAASENRSEG